MGQEFDALTGVGRSGLRLTETTGLAQCIVGVRELYGGYWTMPVCRKVSSDASVRSSMPAFLAPVFPRWPHHSGME